MRFYQEVQSGDYLVVFEENGKNGAGQWDGRGTAIAGYRQSVQGTGVSPAYLKSRCRRVKRNDVPPPWRRVLDPEG